MECIFGIKIIYKMIQMTIIISLWCRYVNQKLKDYLFLIRKNYHHKNVYRNVLKWSAHGKPCQNTITNYCDRHVMH